MSNIPTIVWVLVWYYVPSYILVLWFIKTVMAEAYRIEEVPVPWSLHMKLVATPFVGFWLSALALYLDFSRHLVNQEYRSYKKSKEKEEEREEEIKSRMR